MVGGRKPLRRDLRALLSIGAAVRSENRTTKEQAMERALVGRALVASAFVSLAAGSVHHAVRGEKILYPGVS